MSYAMTRHEREAFLADVHVGILGVAEEGRGPLLVPVWYGYAPGQEVWFETAQSSRKAQLLEKVRRMSLCVQTETSPYKYVRVEGPVVAIEPADLERHSRPLARRYLGTKEGDAYIEEMDSAVESVLIRMRPERWYTVDYSKE